MRFPLRFDSGQNDESDGAEPRLSAVPYVVHNRTPGSAGLARAARRRFVICAGILPSMQKKCRRPRLDSGLRYGKFTDLPGRFENVKSKYVVPRPCALLME